MKAPRLIRQWRRYGGKSGPEKAALGALFDSGNPLSRYPGPAMVVDGEGRVLASNGWGGVEAEASRLVAPLAIAKAISDSVAEDAARIEAAVVPEAASGGRVELTILPVGDGTSALVLGRDVLLEHNLRTALVESRQRYKDLVEISSDFAWETDADGKFAFVSPQGALGYRAEELVGRSPGDFLVEDWGAEMPTPFSATDPLADVELWLRRADGSPACLLASCVPLLGDHGEWLGARGVCRDITEARERDSALARARNRERLLTYMVRTMRDEVDPLDMLGAAAAATARAISASGCRIYRRDSVLTIAPAAEFGDLPDAEAIEALLHELDRTEVSVTAEIDGGQGLAIATRHHHAVNGAIFLWRKAGGIPWSDNDRGWLLEVADQLGIANEQIANHEQLRKLSRTDGLTGLLNRRTFFNELQQRYETISATDRSAVLIYCDLDNFKLVNDHYGHQRGDAALIRLSEILHGNVRAGDLLARLGGDEFACWLEGADLPAGRERARELLEACRALEDFSTDLSHPLTVSLGIAVVAPGSGESVEDLMARADQAMYMAKHGGKARFEVAAPPAAAQDRRMAVP
jgi:diguanylate cyclase (GGDEF)-like protein/PAS domain S-box-containing protein